LFSSDGTSAAMTRHIQSPLTRGDYLAGNGSASFSRYSASMIGSASPVGGLLREWRQRRRMSQLDVAMDAEISARHLSFIETGRSQPSRDMVLRLSERLEIPLRERNVLLVAAGFAPVFQEKKLDDPTLTAARQAVDLVLKGHEPYPALAIDRHWMMVAANASVAPLLVGCAPALLKPPVNVLRLSLHPDGLAPRIANLAEWRSHLIARLKRQIDVTADAELVKLLEQLQSYPVPSESRARIPLTRQDLAGIAIPLQLVTGGGVRSFFSTTTVFGTPVDITLSELAIEAFFPADTETAEAMRALAS
jgi:transcriptional regulator with XRE-family HTH domain